MSGEKSITATHCEAPLVVTGMEDTDEELKNPEEVFHGQIIEDIKVYNDEVKSSLDLIDGGLDVYDDLLKNTKDNYDDMIKDTRRKFSMVAMETAKSVTTIVKERIALGTKKVDLQKQRLETNTKLRAIAKEVKKSYSGIKKDSDDTFDPVIALNGISKYFKEE